MTNRTLLDEISFSVNTAETQTAFTLENDGAESDDAGKKKSGELWELRSLDPPGVREPPTSFEGRGEIAYRVKLESGNLATA